MTAGLFLRGVFEGKEGWGVGGRKLLQALKENKMEMTWISISFRT